MNKGMKEKKKVMQRDKETKMGVINENVKATQNF
jgi:hypothetical protein